MCPPLNAEASLSGMIVQWSPHGKEVPGSNPAGTFLYGFCTFSLYLRGFSSTLPMIYQLAKLGTLKYAPCKLRKSRLRK